MTNVGQSQPSSFLRVKALQSCEVQRGPWLQCASTEPEKKQQCAEKNSKCLKWESQVLLFVETLDPCPLYLANADLYAPVFKVPGDGLAFATFRAFQLKDFRSHFAFRSCWRSLLPPVPQALNVSSGAAAAQLTTSISSSDLARTKEAFFSSRMIEDHREDHVWASWHWSKGMHFIYWLLEVARGDFPTWW